MTARTKLIEVTLQVRVPKDWSATHTKREVADGWWGSIYAVGPRRGGDLGVEAVLKPRWVSARELPETPAKAKVWVLMGNDYPDAVFTDEAAGERVIAQLRAKHAAEKKAQPYSTGPGIHWRLYPFELDAAAVG